MVEHSEVTFPPAAIYSVARRHSLRASAYHKCFRNPVCLRPAENTLCLHASLIFCRTGEKKIYQKLLFIAIQKYTKHTYMTSPGKNCTGFPFQNVLTIKLLVCVSVL